MERKLSLLFGIFGGVFVILLNGPLSMALSSLQGFVTYIVIQILSVIGIIAIVYFSILLIIDALRTVHKRDNTLKKRNISE